MNAVLRYYFIARRTYRLSPADAWREAVTFHGDLSIFDIVWE